MYIKRATLVLFALEEEAIKITVARNKFKQSVCIKNYNTISQKVSSGKYPMKLLVVLFVMLTNLDNK